MKEIQILLICLVSMATAAEEGGCVSTSLSIDEKLRINAAANDHDNNQIVDASDVAYDLSHNYDTNGDGAVTEDESITRWTCAFGDTVYFARFVFNLLSRGQAEIRPEQFNVPPLDTGIPLSRFIELNRQRYELFSNDSCVNTDLTLDQKLDINAQQNDHNNDGLVTSDDIAYDLNNRYDANKDGKVTQAEWVLHWSCAYGDTAAYARYTWQQIGRGAEYIQSSQFSGPPFDTGIPIAAFRASNRQRYETYGRASESSWKITIICRVYSPPLCKLIYTKINISYTNTKLKLWCYFLNFRNIRNFTNLYIQQKAVKKKNPTHTVMTAKKAAHTPRRLTTLA
ncbi:uncharacterized protein LOC112561116 [Pomacea canaliculata]|uniref:uncharacterized protein LOC112561116 n=1 Tax=Pomacea canaliculata TaxID=400727 RepID=UPI000D732024|nr:uncharacterized protein LOC112561116 [Pomacea canaliculata]